MLLFGSQAEPERRTDEEFRAFWESYPRRVGKLAAQTAYQKARKMASAADILAGVERYKEHKPEYADWAHPKTWLNQGRWLDEYEQRTGDDRRRHERGSDRRVGAMPTYSDDWWEECKRLHDGTCEQPHWHRHRMNMEARNKANV